MLLENVMIILKSEISDSVASYSYDKDTKKYNITFNNGKTYSYSKSNVIIIRNSEALDVNLYQFTNKQGKIFTNIEKILFFKGKKENYFRLFYKGKGYGSYRHNDLTVYKNALSNSGIENHIGYYKNIADKVGLKVEDDTNILRDQLEKLSFVRDDSILSMFLQGKTNKTVDTDKKSTVIFPFGSNSSQIQAVNNALNNKISIIEGPSGTGKTQTILNVIANIILNGQTVAIVSNNNSATDNVYEKLEKYGVDFISAQLGNSDNKKAFIANKQKNIPNLETDIQSQENLAMLNSDITALEQELSKMFEKQNKIAILKQDLASLITEKGYFEEYFTSTYEKIEIFRNKNKLSSHKILSLWINYQEIIEKSKNISLFFKLKSIFVYGIKDFKLFRKDSANVIALLKKYFYEFKIQELQKEIDDFTNELEKFSFNDAVSALSDKSFALFKHTLAKKYERFNKEIIFDDDVFWKSPNDFLQRYPIVLSSTYSSKSSLTNVVYDYVIVDEASQVDLATGTLAMLVAKNIVVVGDLMQLPNVISEKDKADIEIISDKANIQSGYRYEKHSLLSSICEVFPDAPKTLLKEHYRCHPKIINFCNQKFYNSQLVIMTSDSGENDVLGATITAKGNHEREHFNQRQIDEIKQVILPELDSNSVGIITPYRKQTKELDKDLKDLNEKENIDISTVHKFQGREKDDIIISTVDNEISDFTDNPNMLNVAVSRAKNRLRLIVSDNEKNNNTNIGDLIKYIQYNNFEVRRSDIFSVFDMLYKSYESQRKELLSKYKNVSDYDSENLMYTVISDVLAEDRFSKFDVVTHQLFNGIIRDFHKLTEDEIAYVMNDLTHVDFLIYNTIDKSMVLAVEVDGYAYHKAGTKQSKRDTMKDAILEKYDIPFIRFSTIQNNEKERLQEKMMELLRR